jgi:hypothetical protein
MEKSHATWQEELTGMLSPLILLYQGSADFLKLSVASCVSQHQSSTSCLTVAVCFLSFTLDRETSCPYVSFEALSDRSTGGRTAWTSTVTIQGHNIPARNWYDGQFLNNAKEDAAEVALIKMRNPSLTAQSSRSQGRHSTAGWVR